MRAWEDKNGPITKEPNGNLKKFLEDMLKADQEEDAQFKSDWESKNGPLDNNDPEKRAEFHKEKTDLKKSKD